MNVLRPVRSASIVSGIDSDDECVEELNEHDILDHLELTPAGDEEVEEEEGEGENEKTRADQQSTQKGDAPSKPTTSVAPELVKFKVQSPKPDVTINIPNLRSYDTMAKKGCQR